MTVSKISSLSISSISKIYGIELSKLSSIYGQTIAHTWLTGWSYRKSITLSRASGAVTNYQMKLLVGESSGATGENVDCGGKCKTDFSDLRFTTSDKTTLLDYWIESVSGTTPNQLATIWVEFDSIGTGDTTFYMYYGNSGASAYSNGENTFPFFDDFDDASLDTNKWTNIRNTGVVESGGNVVVTDTGNNGNGIRGKTAFNTTYALRTRTKPLYYNNTSYLSSIRFELIDSTKQLGVYFSHPNKDFNAKFTNYTSTTGWTNSNIEGGSANWMIVDIRRNSNTNVTYLIDNSNTVTISSKVITDNLYPSIISYANGSRSDTDWILVRQYLATEPAWGSWGTEETN
jgi:hypothetical protein